MHGLQSFVKTKHGGDAFGAQEGSHPAMSLQQAQSLKITSKSRRLDTSRPSASRANTAQSPLRKLPDRIDAEGRQASFGAASSIDESESEAPNIDPSFAARHSGHFQNNRNRYDAVPLSFSENMGAAAREHEGLKRHGRQFENDVLDRSLEEGQGRSHVNSGIFGQQAVIAADKQLYFPRIVNLGRGDYATAESKNHALDDIASYPTTTDGDITMESTTTGPVKDELAQLSALKRDQSSPQANVTTEVIQPSPVRKALSYALRSNVDYGASNYDGQSWSTESKTDERGLRTLARKAKQSNMQVAESDSVTADTGLIEAAFMHQRKDPQNAAAIQDGPTGLHVRSTQSQDDIHQHRNQWSESMLRDGAITRSNKVHYLHGQQTQQDDLEYLPTDLLKMKFEDLMQEGFDEHVDALEGRSLEDMLAIAKDRSQDEQDSLFRGMTMQQWEQSGRWMNTKLAEVTEQLADLRRKRREIAMEFERKVNARHQTVCEEREGLQQVLSEMNSKGRSLLTSTPRGTPRHKTGGSVA